MIRTGWQILQGRELVGRCQADLAAAAGVGLAVVIRAGMAAHAAQVTRTDSAAIQRTLEAVGVEFVREDGGIGVRLRGAEM